MIDLAPEQHAADRGLLIQSRDDLDGIVVTGRDGRTWLNGLVTCELAKSRPGDGAFGLAVGKTGKVLAEMFFVLEEDRIVLGVPRAVVAEIVEHFDRHLVMEDAAIAPAEPALAWSLASGPRADEAVAAVRRAGGHAARVDWTARGDGLVFATDAAHAGEVEAAVMSLDAALRARREAAEALRVAWGIPRFGVDYGTDNLPHEAALEKLAVSFTKGCYLGQEAVFMLEARGHAKKHLCLVEVPGGRDVARGAEVALKDGGAVGEVTSAVATPEGALALAFVKHKHAAVGVELVIAGQPARVLRLAARTG